MLLDPEATASSRQECDC